MKRCTRKRVAALQWFKDHEADPLSVLMADKPSTKMRRLMVKEGQVARLPVGQFGFDRWILTYAGREMLALASMRGREHAPTRQHPGTTTHQDDPERG